MTAEVSLDEAIRVFDLERYVCDHGGEEVQNGEWVLECPKCLKPKLAVNIEKKTWHCWYCQSLPGVEGRGGLLDLIAFLETRPKHEVARTLIAAAQYSPVEYNLGGLAYPGWLGIPKPVPVPSPENWHPVDGTLPYLSKRGILLSAARAFGLVWCDAGRYAGRLIFPVWEEGQLVYYQGRAMWEESDRPGERYIKALNPPKQEGAAVSSEVLLNLDVARNYPRVAVVEGPIDCVKAGPSAVCTFGKKISGMQIAKLQRSGVRAIDLMWDGPSEREPQGAWPEMLAIAPTLSMLFDVRLVFLPHGDPGQRTTEELDYWRSVGQPVERGATRL